MAALMAATFLIHDPPWGKFGIISMAIFAAAKRAGAAAWSGQGLIPIHASPGFFHSRFDPHDGQGSGSNSAFLTVSFVVMLFPSFLFFGQPVVAHLISRAPLVAVEQGPIAGLFDLLVAEFTEHFFSTPPEPFCGFFPPL